VIEGFAITLPALVFMAVLCAAVVAARRQRIDPSGTPPIDRRLFLASKCGMVAAWTAMILTSWGAPLAFIEVRVVVRAAAILSWLAGLSVLFFGCLHLGSSLRMGSPKEQTTLKTRGMYQFCRNPMYLGLYLTCAASALYTLNPLVLLVGLFVVAVHHRIVLAEERFLSAAFPADYADYCGRVRRYL
jgi:protein-S-isoprenylcysteine O-methyltransferase Ste14